ncbi:MAG: hypothetical protein ACK2VA_02805 [Anaerolineae bacterium]|jgi:hypothetical protein
MSWQVAGVRVAPVLVLLFGVGAALAVLYLIQLRRTARSTSYGYVREQAITRARQLVMAGTVLVVLALASGTLWFVSVRNPGLLPTPAPTATPTLLPTPTPRPPTATFTPTSTPTVTPTPTATPVLPGAELPSVLRTPLPAGAAAVGDAQLVDVVLAAGVEENQPVGPALSFPAGTDRVYAFLTFEGMSRGVPVTYVWYAEVGGEMTEAWGRVELWPYDAPRGVMWRYLSARDGRYELRVYIGQELRQRVLFTVGVE